MSRPSALDFKKIAKASDNSENVNSLLAASKWDTLTDLLRLWKIWQLNVAGKKMSFSIEYDGFHQVFIAHNHNRTSTPAIHWLDTWETLREIVTDVLKNENDYVQFEQTFKETLASLEGKDRELVDKLSHDMSTSLNTRFMDRLVITWNFSSMEKSLKKLFSSAFNWNASWTGKWFDIKYDPSSNSFVAYDFNSYWPDGKLSWAEFWKATTLKGLLINLYDEFVIWDTVTKSN